MAFDPKPLLDAWWWWNRPAGVAIWAENNQGLISVLALGAALVLALFEQKRALAAEARAHRAAEEAKAEAALEAREAEITHRLVTLSEFAVVARGVLRDVENELLDDLQAIRDFMFEMVEFDVPGEPVRESARASIGTLNALLAGVQLSPNLIRATRQGMAVLHAIGDRPTPVNDETYRDVYDGWRARLSAASMSITDAELEIIQRLRPSPPAPAPALTRDETGFGSGPF